MWEKIRKARKLILVMVLVCGIGGAGCAALKQAVVIPAGCENSIIYKNIPYADLANVAITVTGMEVFKAAKARGVDMAPVISCLQQLDVLLDTEGLTYTQFVGALANANSYIKAYAGVEIVLLTNMVDNMFRAQTTMDACDRQYLDRAIKGILTNLNIS